jgi:hypothetical protein
MQSILWSSTTAVTTGPHPSIVVEICRETDVATVGGVSGKSHRKKSASHGYLSQHQIVRATEVGGSVSQARTDDRHPHQPQVGSSLQGYERRVGNPTLPYAYRGPCLTCSRPAGLVPRASWSTTRSIADLPVRGRDPMPAHAGTWISDEGRAWRLLTEELAKGLGAPKSWGDLELLDPRLLGWQTCSPIYERWGNVLATADVSTEDNSADENRQQFCRRLFWQRP